MPIQVIGHRDAAVVGSGVGWSLLVRPLVNLLGKREVSQCEPEDGRRLPQIRLARSMLYSESEMLLF